MPKEQEVVARETEKGRPLWLSEINKQVPAGASYDIESTFGNSAQLFRTRAYAFQSSNAEQNKTMREEPTLSHFMGSASTVPEEGVASYEIKMTQTKKRVPQYTMANAKQHTTFDFEIGQALQKPDPAKHFICEN